MGSDTNWWKRRPATSSLRGSTTAFYHQEHFAPPLNYFAHSALKSTPMTPASKCLLPTATTSTPALRHPAAFGSLSTQKSQSVGSQAPEWDLSLALASITWCWFSGALSSWETCSITYPIEPPNPSTPTFQPICDLDVYPIPSYQLLVIQNTTLGKEGPALNNWQAGGH